MRSRRSASTETLEYGAETAPIPLVRRIASPVVVDKDRLAAQIARLKLAPPTPAAQTETKRIVRRLDSLVIEHRAEVSRSRSRSPRSRRGSRSHAQPQAHADADAEAPLAVARPSRARALVVAMLAASIAVVGCLAARHPTQARAAAHAVASKLSAVRQSAVALGAARP